MITSVKFVDDHICFVKGQAFELKPITLLVGDQGCGKSTMLNILRNGSPSVEFKHLKMVGPEAKGVILFDLEKDNPRVQSGDPNSSKDMLYKLTARAVSHGETLLPLLESIGESKDTYILLDEPETSLSLRSQFRMIEVFKKALENGCQVVLATHNLVFMEAFPDCVLSLEHQKYVTPAEFVKLEKKTNDFKEKREDKRIKKEKCAMGNACSCANLKGWYNNQCENYIGRDGKPLGKKGNKPWEERQ